MPTNRRFDGHARHRLDEADFRRAASHMKEPVPPQNESHGLPHDMATVLRLQSAAGNQSIASLVQGGIVQRQTANKNSPSGTADRFQVNDFTPKEGTREWLGKNFYPWQYHRSVNGPGGNVETAMKNGGFIAGGFELVWIVDSGRNGEFYFVKTAAAKPHDKEPAKNPVPPPTSQEEPPPKEGERTKRKKPPESTDIKPPKKPDPPKDPPVCDPVKLNVMFEWQDFLALPKRTSAVTQQIAVAVKKWQPCNKSVEIRISTPWRTTGGSEYLPSPKWNGKSPYEVMVARAVYVVEALRSAGIPAGVFKRPIVLFNQAGVQRTQLEFQ